MKNKTIKKLYSINFILLFCIQFTIVIGQPTGAKYDVSLQLKKVTASKVVDIDGNDELYGSMLLHKFSCSNPSLIVVTPIYFWLHYDKSDPISGWYKMDMGGLKSRDVNNKQLLIKNLTFKELTSAEFDMGGRLSDDETNDGQSSNLFAKDIIYALKQYSGTSNGIAYRAFRIDGSGEYNCPAYDLANQIAAWPADGIERPLKICTGGDNFFRLDWVEKDHPDASHEVFWFTIWIKPHL